MLLSRRDDLQPVLSFDRHRLWAGACGADRGDAMQRLRPWRELLARIDAQPHWQAAHAELARLRGIRAE